MNQQQNRKLAAILFADIVGYTALMQSNEPEALAALHKFKTELETQVPNHKGEIIQFYGDGCLVVFNSSVDAVTCAKKLQLAFQSEPKVPVRIGLHAGDVVFKEANVFGDAVNIASRVESMGVSGAVLLSSNVRNQIKNQPEFDLVSLGKFEFKNVVEGMTVYALGNEGMVLPKKDEMKGKVKENIPKTNNYRLLITVVLLSLVGLFFYNKYGKETRNNITETTAKKPSIALLQFEDGSPDKSLAYLGFGLKEELLTSLIKLQKLEIVSSSRIKVSQEQSNDPQVIGVDLQADYVLSGSVLANENTIRFNVRLLDVANQSFIWAHNEDSPRSEILQLQQNFATAIAKNLPIQTTTADLKAIQKTDVDSKAYDLYLKGVYQTTFLESEAYNSTAYLLEAIGIEPDFALALAHLAANEATIAEFGSELPIPHWIKARKYVDRALALDSLNAVALGIKGRIQSNFEWDFPAAEITFKKAATLNPEQKYHYAFFLAFNGRNEELLEHIRDWEDDNTPLVAQLFILAGDIDTAEKILWRFENELSTNWYVSWTYSVFYLHQREYSKAIPYLEQAVSLSQTNLFPLMHLGFAYGKIGKKAEAKKILEQLNNFKKTRYVPAFCIAAVYVGLEDFDSAFQELNESLEKRDFYIRTILTESIYHDPLIQNDPRFQKLLTKMNLGHLPPRTSKPLTN